MEEVWKSRTTLLLGEENVEKLAAKHILIVGIGGVGGYAAEQLARAGIGEMTLIDADIIDVTNINRQIIATAKNVGQAKVNAISERLLAINPQLILHPFQIFLRDEETERILDLAHYDYLVDAIDSLSPKSYLIYFAMQRKIPIVSAMGAGGKMDPSKVQICDIKKTCQCGLAAALRKRLRKLGINSGFKAVFSPEHVTESCIEIDADPTINKLSVTGTISYMPAIFGCFMAATVIQDLVNANNN